MKNVYEECPSLENSRFLLRLIKEEDAEDLLKVYSDKKSVVYFNSDNCNGNDFYIDTYENMKEAVKYWLMEYDRCGFVRFSIVDKENINSNVRNLNGSQEYSYKRYKKDEVIGTIELFNRKADDYFNNCGLLRLDLRSDYEEESIIFDILNIVVEDSYELFDCTSIATKAQDFAKERIAALNKYGFTKSSAKLIGHDKTEYGDYWIIFKK